MTQTFRKIAIGCASALVALFTVACSGEQTQEAPKPATETSQAPAQQQAAPAEAAAPAQGSAPAQQGAPAQQPPAQGQQPPQQ